MVDTICSTVQRQSDARSCIPSRLLVAAPICMIDEVLMKDGIPLLLAGDLDHARKSSITVQHNYSPSRKLAEHAAVVD